MLRTMDELRGAAKLLVQARRQLGWQLAASSSLAANV